MSFKIPDFFFLKIIFLFFSGEHINLDLTKMKTASGFCHKLWQAARFIAMAKERC